VVSQGRRPWFVAVNSTNSLPAVAKGYAKPCPTADVMAGLVPAIHGVGRMVREACPRGLAIQRTGRIGSAFSQPHGHGAFRAFAHPTCYALIHPTRSSCLPSARAGHRDTLAGMRAPSLRDFRAIRSKFLSETLIRIR